MRPALESELHEDDMYLAMYLCERGNEIYRITDSLIDSSILD